MRTDRLRQLPCDPATERVALIVGAVREFDAVREEYRAF
jgi:hypothetical protein